MGAREVVILCSVDDTVTAGSEMLKSLVSVQSTCSNTHRLLFALSYLDVTLLTTVGAKQTLGRGMQCPSCHPPCSSGRYCFYCLEQLVL